MWNPIVDMSAAWNPLITIKDSTGVPIAIQAPAYMDLRIGPLPSAMRVARLDATGAADGTITINAGAGTMALHLSSTKTALLIAGRYSFDLFVTDPGGQLMKLLFGTATFVQNVSLPS